MTAVAGAAGAAVAALLLCVCVKRRAKTSDQQELAALRRALSKRNAGAAGGKGGGDGGDLEAQEDAQRRAAAARKVDQVLPAALLVRKKKTYEEDMRGQAWSETDLQRFRREHFGTTAAPLPNTSEFVQEQRPSNVSRSTFHTLGLRVGWDTDPHRDPQLLRSDLSAFVAGAPESRGQGKAHSL